MPVRNSPVPIPTYTVHAFHTHADILGQYYLLDASDSEHPRSQSVPICVWTRVARSLSQATLFPRNKRKTRV